jgi:hypothetical protein
MFSVWKGQEDLTVMGSIDYEKLIYLRLCAADGRSRAHASAYSISTPVPRWGILEN